MSSKHSQLQNKTTVPNLSMLETIVLCVSLAGGEVRGLSPLLSFLWLSNILQITIALLQLTISIKIPEWVCN